MVKMMKWLVPLAVLAALLAFWQQRVQLPAAEPVAIEEKMNSRLLLVPLDTRPPCQKMVIDAGKMAGIDVAVPPGEMMDYYTRPGDTKAQRQWLLDNIKDSSGAIISVDQLLHGGLLASREAGTKADESEQLIAFLRQLKAKAPDKPLYVFSVLPRITPPPTLESSSKKMIKLSRLADEISIFGSEADMKEFDEVMADDDIKRADWETYLDLFRRNTRLNKELIKLADEGIIERLVIGQDDGEDFGVPNMEKRALINFCHSAGIGADKAVLTKGADEVALSLLALHAVKEKSGSRPRVYVEYNDSAAPRTVMPFMAGSVGSTVREKLLLADAQQVYSPDEADIILYVFIGDDDNLETRRSSAAKLKTYLQQGKQVALVDLSRHFAGAECVLPQLLQQEAPLNALTAYAGWNTASNSIGTALADALIYHASLPAAASKADRAALEYNRLSILYSRILEDYYYLKDVIDGVNNTLISHGYANVNDLDMEHNYLWMNDLLQQAMERRADELWHSRAAQLPYAAETPEGTLRLVPRYLHAETFFPWPRTFEVYMQARFNLYSITN